MELKVWVEGIQRVVCGVSEATTCQDVVVALAHATGKIGRFTLIEKWRDTERLLAPADYPLKALHKWGEYSSEVVFVLKHSEKHRKERHSSRRTEKSKHKFNSPSTPLNDSNSEDTPSKGIKKSLTFSGAHSYPKNHLTNVRRHLIQETSPLDAIDDQSSVTSHSSSISTMSPYGSLEKRSHRHNHHHRAGYSSLAGGGNKHSGGGSSGGGSLEKHKTKGHRLKAPSSPFGSSSSAAASPKSDSFSSPPHSPHELTPKIEQLEEYDLDRNLTNQGPKSNGGVIANHQHTGSTDFTKVNGNVGKDTEFREGSASPRTTQVPPLLQGQKAEKEDLSKLIKLQQEKLSVQASQIKVLDTEIEFLEARDRDCERLAAQNATDLEMVQQKDAEVDNELQELDIVSWADKLEIEKQNQKTLQAEITLMRSKLSNCETELLQTKNRSLLLNNEMEAEKKDVARREQEQKKQEIKVLQDISEVQKQLNEELKQYEKTQENTEELQMEVKNVESAILDRKTHLADCDRELRGANLEIFMKVPNSLEGSTPVLNRNSPSRPGSARRMMYSPLFLKEAVATTTNPHGLWV